MTYNSDLLEKSFDNLRVQWTEDAKKNTSIDWTLRYNQFVATLNGYNTGGVFTPPLTPQAAWDYFFAELPALGYPELFIIFEQQADIVLDLTDWPIPFDT